jgi:hypothetical protein
MILYCSGKHVWDTMDMQTRLTHNSMKVGGRCPGLMSYDRMSGSTYCRRVLKEIKPGETVIDWIGDKWNFHGKVKS